MFEPHLLLYVFTLANIRIDTAKDQTSNLSIQHIQWHLHSTRDDEFWLIVNFAAAKPMIHIEQKVRNYFKIFALRFQICNEGFFCTNHHIFIPRWMARATVSFRAANDKNMLRLADPILLSHNPLAQVFVCLTFHSTHKNICPVLAWQKEGTLN